MIKSLYLYPDSYISTMISSSIFESFVVVKASCNSGSKLSPTLPNGLTPLDSSFLLKSSISTSVLLVLGIMIIPSLTRLFI